MLLCCCCYYYIFYIYSNFLHYFLCLCFSLGSLISLLHLRVYIVNDFCPEPTEYFRLQLYVPGGDVIMGNQFRSTVEINDDDTIAKSSIRNLEHFSDGTQSDLNCVRRVPERSTWNEFQKERDRVIPFLSRVEEQENTLGAVLRSVGSKVNSRSFMSEVVASFTDGSPVN